MDIHDLVGHQLDTINVFGEDEVHFVTDRGTVFILHNMKIDCFDGELADLLEGRISHVSVTERVYFLTQDVDVTVGTDYGSVVFHFNGGRGLFGGLRTTVRY